MFRESSPLRACAGREIRAQFLRRVPRSPAPRVRGPSPPAPRRHDVCGRRRERERAMDTGNPGSYVLGNEPEELARLDRQAAAIDGASRLLLQAAGLGPGMRVLDLGTGLGHVARLAAALVAPHGTIVGIDQSPSALAVARRRAEEAGETRVSFVEGDVTQWVAPEPFDAVIGRLVL